MPRSRAIILTIISGVLITAVIGFSISYSRTLTQTQNTHVTLSMVGFTYQESTVDPLIQEYEKSNPNITITYKQIDKSSYRDYLLQSFHSNSPVDIFEAMSSDEDAFLKYTYAAPQDILTPAQFSQVYYPLYNRGLIFNNKYVLGIPENIQPLIIVYNKDLAAKAGINMQTSVTSLTGFNTTIQAFKAKTQKIAGVNIGQPGNILESADILQLFMLQDSTTMNDSTGQNAAFATTQGQQALQYYKSFVNGDYSDSWQSNSSNDLSQFASGKVLMLITYPENIPLIKSLNSNINMGYAQMPSLNTPITFAHYKYLTVDAKSTSPKEAWGFLKFIAKKNNFVTLSSQENLSNPYDLIPSREDISSSITDPTLKSILTTVSPIARDWNYYDYQKTSDIFNSLISDYLSSGNPSYFLSLAQKDITTIIQKSFEL